MLFRTMAPAFTSFTSAISPTFGSQAAWLFTTVLEKYKTMQTYHYRLYMLMSNNDFHFWAASSALNTTPPRTQAISQHRRAGFYKPFSAWGNWFSKACDGHRTDTQTDGLLRLVSLTILNKDKKAMSAFIIGAFCSMFQLLYLSCSFDFLFFGR